MFQLLPTQWEKALGLVRKRLNNAHEFESWFLPIELVGVKENELQLLVEDRLFADWLSDNDYLSLLTDALEETTGTSYEVRFWYKSSAKANNTLEESRDVGSSPQRHPHLIPDYVFDTFVKGPSNELAYAACRAIAESPASTYNPMFIYGGSGLGKTHLLHAVGNEVLRRDPASQVKYVTSETYFNELVQSIRGECTQEFRERYRDQCDILLIDDIQFFEGKARTQEEFFHTFNALYGASKQIVFSSDRFPEEIPGIAERLRSRFQWGLIADIKPPEIETRIAILAHKAEQRAVDLPRDVAMFIATRVRSNVRQLEGALTKLAAMATLNKVNITLPMAKDVLKDFLPDEDRPLTADDITRAVATYYCVKTTDIKGPRRHKAISLPRQVAMTLTRRLTPLSYPEIGTRFGGRDHTTVISAVRKIERLLEEQDASVKKAIKILERQLEP